jgi:hypothetical protein
MSVVTLTPEKIHKDISYMITSGIPYIDALVEYSEKNNLEIEVVASVVKKNSVLREKVKSEAIKLRMVNSDDIDITEFSK